MGEMDDLDELAAKLSKNPDRGERCHIGRSARKKQGWRAAQKAGALKRRVGAGSTKRKPKVTLAPAKGFFDGLTPKQKRKALEYTGDESFGDPRFLISQSGEETGSDGDENA